MLLLIMYIHDMVRTTKRQYFIHLFLDLQFMLARLAASWLVTCNLMYMCISSYMYAFMIRGWWNLNIGSVPVMETILYKIYSSI